VLTATTTIKAFADKSGLPDSAISSAIFPIKIEPTPTPTPTPTTTPTPTPAPTPTPDGGGGGGGTYTGSITGIVMDENQNAVAGAQVSLDYQIKGLERGTPRAVSRAVAVTTSGSDGRYAFTGVAPGSYTVTATKSGYSVSSYNIDVAAGSTVTQDIVLIGITVLLRTGNEPRALATGDFNSDGKPDMAVANGTDSTVTVFINNGDNTFQTKAAIATGTTPCSVAVGDFDGNGNNDMAVANSGSHNVTVLLGDGTGAFTPAAGSPVAAGTNPSSVAVGDFTGDGNWDLAVTNKAPLAMGTLSIIPGNGNGTFQAKSDSNLGNDYQPSCAAVGDYNKDGYPDLAFPTGSGVQVLLNRGDAAKGLFDPAVAYAIAGNESSQYSAVDGDFNGDTWLDLATTWAVSPTGAVQALLNNKQAVNVNMFPASLHSKYTTGAQPLCVSSGDVNGDGYLDLVTANGNGTSLSLLLGKGDGTFQVEIRYVTTYAPYYVALGDFRGDGKPDLVVVYQSNAKVSLILLH